MYLTMGKMPGKTPLATWASLEALAEHFYPEISLHTTALGMNLGVSQIPTQTQPDLGQVAQPIPSLSFLIYEVRMLIVCIPQGPEKISHLKTPLPATRWALPKSSGKGKSRRTN